MYNADDSHIFLTTSAEETYSLQFFIGLSRTVVTAKWSGNTFLEINNGNDLTLKITLKAKKIRNHFETKEGWSKQPFWRDLYSVLCCLQNPEMAVKVVSEICKHCL